MKKIQLKVSSILSDRTAYKKYGVTYTPEDLRLEIDVPDEFIIEGDHINVTVSEEGLKWIVNKLATLIDEVEDEYIAKVKKKG